MVVWFYEELSGSDYLGTVSTVVARKAWEEFNSFIYVFGKILILCPEIGFMLNSQASFSNILFTSQII